MSTVATAPLAPDPVFPCRDELLDAAGLRVRLATLLDEEVDRCERVRATYHPGRSLRTLLRVSAPDGERWVSARMFPPGTSTPRFERARVAADGARGVLHDEDLATVFTVFPVDRKLTALRRLAQGSWPPISGAASATFRLFAYAPEKAATVAALDDGGRMLAFVKLHADARAVRTVTVHRSLRARGVEVPAVLASWPGLQALALEPLPGTRLAAVDDVTGWHALGAALGRLHALEPVDARRSARLELHPLRAAATTIAALRPDVAAKSWRLEGALRRMVPARPGPTVCLHGDVQPKNVLLHGGSASLVDLDDVAGGVAAADLGSALALLRYDELLGRRESACAEALLDGYREVAPPPSLHALRWYTAAALLGERALRTITRLRASGLAQLDTVLTAGLEELA